MTISKEQTKHLFRNVIPLLVKVYGEATAQTLIEKLYELLQEHLKETKGENLYKWDQNVRPV